MFCHCLILILWILQCIIIHLIGIGCFLPLGGTIPKWPMPLCLHFLSQHHLFNVNLILKTINHTTFFPWIWKQVGIYCTVHDDFIVNPYANNYFVQVLYILSLINNVMLIRKGVSEVYLLRLLFFIGSRQGQWATGEKADPSQCEEVNVMHCLFLLEVLAQSALFRSRDLLFK